MSLSPGIVEVLHTQGRQGVRYALGGHDRLVPGPWNPCTWQSYADEEQKRGR